MNIDLVIPVYKPEKSFIELVDIMSRQDLPINKIIIINTEQKYFDRLAYSTKFLDNHKSLNIRHISKREYDCGKTRNAAVRLSDAEYFLMMSQKALPVGTDLVKKLADAITADPKIAVAYARQEACDEAPECVKFATQYTYPEDSAVRSEKDYETLNWTTYMNSNTCALYRRDLFEELGGFETHIITNEDILFAAKAVKAGYKVSYVSDAVVKYNSVCSVDEYMKRAFDFTVSVVQNPDVFDLSYIRDSIKNLDKLIVSKLKKQGSRRELFEYKKIYSAKKKGFSRALKYRKMSYEKLAAFSHNPEFWRMDEIMRDRTCIDSRSGYGRSAAEVEMISKPPVKPHKRTEE